jgi:predicted ATP-dependent endonuclease of OLD family
MTIISLEISGYKGFSSKECIKFAIPNGKCGSGITAFVGPNSAGKSSVIETLGSFNKGDISFSSGKRNLKANDRVEVKLTAKRQNDQIYTQTITTVPSGGAQTIKTQIFESNHENFQQINSILSLPSRRFFNPYFSRNNWDRNTYASNMGGSQANRSQPSDGFIYRLFEVNKPENRIKFDEVLSRVMSPLPEWTIDQHDNGTYFLKFKTNELFHGSDGVGEGILNLFFIIDALYDSKEGQTIVIDEPEVSLHPALQRKLMTLLLEYSKDRQIVISTHSPYFLPLEFIGSGMSITRVNTSTDGTKFFTLSEVAKQTLSRLLGDFNFPHALGLNAREIFFLEEEVILVEGQEDVVFYPKIAEQVSKTFRGNFFGWGVGGAGKMKLFAQLLKELGFKKVVGILDKGKDTELSSLKTEFPEYNFYDIPTDDVRTKEAIKPKSAIEGLVNRDGTLKSEHKEFAEQFIDEINSKLLGS